MYFISLFSIFYWRAGCSSHDEGFSLVDLLHEGLPHIPFHIPPKSHLHRCDFGFNISLHCVPNTNDIVRDRCCFPVLPHTPYHIPSTKPHQPWCDFVFGIFFLSSHTCRTQTTPSLVLFVVGLFSSSSTHALPHAEHETTPSRVWFHVQRLFFTLPHMLTMKQHVVL